MRSFVYGVLVVLALLLGFNLGLPLLSPDQTESPRPNLEPQLGTISESDNALSFFSQGVRKMNLRGIEPRLFLQQDGWIASEASRLTTENAEAMQLFIEGTRKTASRSKARDPQYATFDAVNLEALPRDVQGWHQLAELLLLRANLYLTSNDPTSAWRYYFLVWKAANQIRNANGSLIELDVGDSLAQLALSSMRTAMRQSQFDDATWRKLLRDLQAQPLDNGALDESLKSERRFFSLALDAASGKTPSQSLRIGVSSPLVRFLPRKYSLQVQKTLETYTLWLEDIQKRASNCPDAIATEPPNPPEFLTANPLAANGIGNALLTSWVPPYGLATRACKLEQAYRATLIFMALHATTALTNGIPPSNLAVLEGRYFEKLPKDPFALGKNFQWDINGKILRSADGTGYSFEF
ncbi:MAG: hypothetical protein ACK41E_01845 [Deinococcales bacterium]